MAAPSTAPSIDDLRARVSQMQGRPAAQPVATHPVLSGLLQLQTGGVYTVSATSLVGLLMAGPSADGAWSAVVGSSSWGIEALAATGVELSRCILVPDPGPAWLEVAAALIDVVGVVVIVPPASVGDKDAARIAARLRQRGAVLVVQGQWPRADARVALSAERWVGVEHGHGHLQARQATLEVQRGTAPARSRRVWLPDLDLVVRSVEQAESAAAVPLRRSAG